MGTLYSGWKIKRVLRNVGLLSYGRTFHFLIPPPKKSLWSFCPIPGRQNVEITFLFWGRNPKGQKVTMAVGHTTSPLSCFCFIHKHSFLLFPPLLIPYSSFRYPHSLIHHYLSFSLFPRPLHWWQTPRFHTLISNINAQPFPQLQFLKGWRMARTACSG